MQSQDKEILKIIISLSQQQRGDSLSLTYLFDHLPTRLKKNKTDLLSTIRSLENKGYIKTQGINQRTVLIEQTSLATSAVSDSKTTDKQKNKLLTRWEAIASIVGTLLAVVTCILASITFIDDFSQKVRNPASHLIINSESVPFTDLGVLSSGTGFAVLAEGVNPPAIDFQDDNWNHILAKCIEPNDNECQVVIYADTIDMIPNLFLKVTSRATDSPLSIEGIELELVSFKSIENRSIDLLNTFACGGGGKPNYFSIDYFPIRSTYPVVDLSSEYDGRDPEKAIGEKVIATAVCPSGQCDANLYVTNIEEEPMVLRMPFLKDFPAGWYGFKAAVAYSYNGKSYISTDQIRFDVIKPKQLNSWWTSCNRTPFLSFASIDLVAGNLQKLSLIPVLNNPPGTLVFNSDASMERALYSLNLQSGELRHIGKLGLLPGLDDSTFELSPTGWQWAFELNDRGAIESPNIDIGIVDAKTETYVNITRNDKNQNLFPAWSPTGNKIAYVSFSHMGSPDLAQGEADIFVYDLQSGLSKRTTFTPNILEQTPVWLSDNSLAYLMPENRSYYGETTVQNSKIGYGIVDLTTGENILTEIYVESTSQLNYLPDSNSLLISDVYGRLATISLADGSVHEESVLSHEYCFFLDLLKDNFICRNEIDKIVLYGATQYSIERKLEIGRDDKWDNRRELVIGQVTSGGFAIADLVNNQIYEYSEDGVLAYTWSVPNLNELLFWYGSPYSSRNFVIIH